MIEINGNLFEQDCDTICITTNGIVTQEGACVMGRGCALQAKAQFFEIEFELGKLIKQKGNHVFLILTEDDLRVNNRYNVVSFPTKDHWRERSDPQLIERSAEELVTMTNVERWKKVIVPRPGCSNGGLNWESQVKSILEPVLDSRFYVIDY